MPYRNAGAAARIAGTVCFLAGFAFILVLKSPDEKFVGPGLIPDIEAIQREEELERIEEMVKAVEEMRRQNPALFPPSPEPEPTAKPVVRQTPPDWYAAFGMVLMVIGGTLVWWGRRQRWPVFSDLATLRAELSGQQLTLFLRSFSQDGQDDPSERRLPGNRRRGRTTEEAIAAALHRYSAVVAIGRPGEPLPQIGAYRLYVGDEEWQRVVEELAADATAIIMLMGTSAGVRRELQMIRAKNHLPRTIFVASTNEQSTTISFLSMLGDVLGCAVTLPASRLGEQAAALLFTRDGPLWLYCTGDFETFIDRIASRSGMSRTAKILRSRRMERLFAQASTILFWLSIVAWLSAICVGIFAAVLPRMQMAFEIPMLVACGCFILSLLLFEAGGKDPDA